MFLNLYTSQDDINMLYPILVGYLKENNKPNHN